RDTREELRLVAVLQVMDGKRAGHEVERSARQRLLETGHAQLHPLGREGSARRFEHRLARIDAMKGGLRMANEQPARRLSSSRSELEDALGIDPAGLDQFPLQAVEDRDV